VINGRIKKEMKKGTIKKLIKSLPLEPINSESETENLETIQNQRFLEAPDIETPPKTDLKVLMVGDN
jgi:hypothetical protein